MYIADGYGIIFPYMIVDGADDFVDFLKNAFGATEVGRTKFPNGRVANIEMQIGTSRFMIGEPNNEMSKPMPASYYLYAEDVDQTLDMATAHGATELFGATLADSQDRISRNPGRGGCAIDSLVRRFSTETCRQVI